MILPPYKPEDYVVLHGITSNFVHKSDVTQTCTLCGWESFAFEHLGWHEDHCGKWRHE